MKKKRKIKKNNHKLHSELWKECLFHENKFNDILKSRGLMIYSDNKIKHLDEVH